MDRLKVVVLFGGCSEEHDISVKSAKEIIACMDTDKYDVYPIYISKTGEWTLRKQAEYAADASERAQAVISPDKSAHGILVSGKDGCGKIYIDAVFPAMHGRMGEDGRIQGLLEMSGIPYVGCGVESSVLAMDKSLAYLVARNAGVATPEFCVLHDRCAAEAARFAYPVFVKPARSGSSFGVSKVGGAAELDAAVELARRYDRKVLIEEAVSGYEVGCAIMGNGEDLLVGEVDRILLSDGFFRIHQEAHPDEGSENATVTVPADIPKETGERVKGIAKRLYRALGCGGLARVDLFLRENGDIVLNEVNTMPGCTSYSRYPKMMAAAGISMSDWIDRVIALAIARRLA
ncbi:MAG: D-alanine--D-alanine ligase [Clostridiales Family XIII bacterium]|jgi:D-alanine--(R)-lactate ligase|nr:D-alanine--D-alanine ligase [Clostridiales Family XIII bacterium]